jgi:hypothetical protein
MKKETKIEKGIVGQLISEQRMDILRLIKIVDGVSEGESTGKFIAKYLEEINSGLYGIEKRLGMHDN